MGWHVLGEPSLGLNRVLRVGRTVAAFSDSVDRHCVSEGKGDSVSEVVARLSLRCMTRVNPKRAAKLRSARGMNAFRSARNAVQFGCTQLACLVAHLRSAAAGHIGYVAD